MTFTASQLALRRQSRISISGWAHRSHSPSWLPSHIRRLATTQTLASHHDPTWFTELRQSMLARPASYFVEASPRRTTQLFEKMARPFLSRPLRRIASQNSPIIPVGLHPLLCNKLSSPHALMPDGTDKLYWPGLPYERRVWIGGSLWVDWKRYYDKVVGMMFEKSFECRQSIVDVRRRGEGEEGGIVVTVERRFVQIEKIRKKGKEESPQQKEEQESGAEEAAKKSLEDRFEKPLMIETRDILFLRPRAPSTPVKPIKYLPSPKEIPLFSRMIMGVDSTFLSSYSQLTMNKHKLHLDANWARNVEGFPTKLVHGSMTVLLLLQALEVELRSQRKIREQRSVITKHVGNGKRWITGRVRRKLITVSMHRSKDLFEHITYRNVAPLTVDDPLRIMGISKGDTETGDPKPEPFSKRKWSLYLSNARLGGGVAVLGTATTVSFDRPTSAEERKAARRRATIRKKAARIRATQPGTEWQRFKLSADQSPLPKAEAGYDDVYTPLIRRYISVYSPHTLPPPPKPSHSPDSTPSSESPPPRPAEPKLRFVKQLVESYRPGPKESDPSTQNATSTPDEHPPTPFERRGIKKVPILRIRMHAGSLEERRGKGFGWGRRGTDLKVKEYEGPERFMTDRGQGMGIGAAQGWGLRKTEGAGLGLALVMGLKKRKQRSRRLAQRNMSGGDDDVFDI